MINKIIILAKKRRKFQIKWDGWQILTNLIRKLAHLLLDERIIRLRENIVRRNEEIIKEMQKTKRR